MLAVVSRRKAEYEVTSQVGFAALVTRPKKADPASADLADGQGKAKSSGYKRSRARADDY